MSSVAMRLPIFRAPAVDNLEESQARVTASKVLSDCFPLASKTPELVGSTRIHVAYLLCGAG